MRSVAMVVFILCLGVSIVAGFVGADHTAIVALSAAVAWLPPALFENPWGPRE